MSHMNFQCSPRHEQQHGWPRPRHALTRYRFTSNHLGCRVTDLFGSPLVHAPDPPPPADLGNKLGVVASRNDSPGAKAAHTRICQQSRSSAALELLAPWAGMAAKGGGGGGSAAAELDEDTATGAAAAQAVDVARDLEGRPLTRGWVAAMVGLSAGQGDGGELVSYEAPEGSAARGRLYDSQPMPKPMSMPNPNLNLNPKRQSLCPNSEPPCIKPLTSNPNSSSNPNPHVNFRDDVRGVPTHAQVGRRCRWRWWVGAKLGVLQTNRDGRPRTRAAQSAYRTPQDRS